VRPGLLRALVVVACCGLCLLQGAGPAAAHASLVSQTPAKGSTVRVAPQRVVLRFDERIRTPSAVVVTDPSGDRVDRGQTAVLDDTATVRVAVVEPGDYTVAYRVVSADGHPAAGRTSFTFAGSTSGASAVARPSTGAPSGGPGTAWVVAGVAVVLLGAAALLGVGRRRSPAASDNGDRR
jgi:methionine-rich copper-binding protein CopC